MTSKASFDPLPLISAAGPVGIAPDALAQALPGASRSTLNRRLAALVAAACIKPVGGGRSRRYVATTPLSRADIDSYFAQPWQQRPVARFEAALLEATPAMDADKAQRCVQIQALAQTLDKRLLANFLIDWSWGSSVLEGGTYSALDTEALIQYGQRNKDKPTADAVLVLNHKRAAEYLWSHRTLNQPDVLAMHALLTDDHGLEEVAASDHFLPEHQRGKVREYEEVNLGASAYLPPFRPGTGFVQRSLDQILTIALGLAPVQAALYLITRIPYVQVFANGNKRTARLLANAPLLNAGLLPFSFADVRKTDYIRGMAAFYELGSLHVMEQAFVHGYARSVVRGSDIPLRFRSQGFDVEKVGQALAHYVNTGQVPEHPQARIFLK